MFMKLKHLAPMALAMAVGACASSTKDAEPKVTMHWETMNAVDSVSNSRSFTQTLTLTGDLRGVRRVAFNQLDRGYRMVDPNDTLIELLPGYYAIGSPKFAQATGNDTLVFQIKGNGAFTQISYAPGGVHAVMTDGKIEPVNLVLADLLDNPMRYSTPGNDRMTYADEIYRRNEELNGATASVYDVVPSFKSVTLTGGNSTVNMDAIDFQEAQFDNPEAFEITVADNKMTVMAAKKMFPALRTRLQYNFGTGEVELPNVRIVDAPDFGYRGLMLDVVRNYQNVDELHKMLDMMAAYGLNVFHFHGMDDEGWRLEIKALPELTEVGARRGYTENHYDDFLPQMYNGDGNPDSHASTSNGYITEDEFIALLQHADSLGITVLPEIESPGHARAARYAMAKRAEHGDPSYLLHEESDTSRYTSAQSYHDNIMNPALDGPYKFMNTVGKEIKRMYERAGVPLVAIHIGGDEVPRNGWAGSPSMKAMMEREGFENQRQVHAYFVSKVVEDYKNMGIPVAGWQDIALGSTADFDRDVLPQMYSINSWTNHQLAQDRAEAGYPVVLSNVDHYYLDMAASYDPYDKGLTWGGVVDEFKALNGYPWKICPVSDEHKANVKGVSGHLWAETIKSEEDFESRLFPKMLGMAERAWNADSTYTDAEFQAVLLQELPKFDKSDLTYSLRMPGIMVEDGNFMVNSVYPNATIYVTTDGTVPTTASQVVKPGQKVPVGDARQIRAMLVLGNQQSNSSVLNL